MAQPPSHTTRLCRRFQTRASHFVEHQCPDEELFVQMLEDTLSDHERAALDDHIDHCEACAQLVIELTQLIYPTDGELDQRDQLDRIGRYKITTVVGKGGMGAVYEAWDDQLERKIALKLLRADLIEVEERKNYSSRMLREARMLAAITHPHVLTVYDVGVWQDQIYLAMQFVQGGTLKQWLERDTPSWSEILEVYLDAAAGLVAAHERGLVHRDIKPSNILIGEDRGVWVADFGLARSSTPDIDHVAVTTLDTLTRTGAIMGTPAYMSPEQHLGMDADHRSDQFSFCSALYEGLYKHRPFAGSTRRELAFEACAGRVLTPRGEHAMEIPDHIARTLMRGLSADPNDRWPDMRSLIEALGAQPSKVSLRSLGRAGVVAGLLGLSAIGALVLFGPSSPQDPTLTASASARTADEKPSEEATSPEPFEALVKGCTTTDLRGCEALAAALLDEYFPLSSVGYSFTEGRIADFNQLVGHLEQTLTSHCIAKPGVTCTLAALVMGAKMGGDSDAEGEFIPRYYGLVEKACALGGEARACTLVRDIHGYSYYEDEGVYSIKPSKDEFVSIMDRGCDARLSAPCWSGAQEFYESFEFERDIALVKSYLHRGCEADHATSCALAGVLTWPTEPGECQRQLALVQDLFPHNDIFSSSSDGSDTLALCKHSAGTHDLELTRARWRRGCDLKDQPASEINCQLIEAIDG